MTLFLKTKDMFDMPLDGDVKVDDKSNPNEKRITHWFGNLAFVVIGLICKLLWRYRIVNRQVLRDLKGKSGAIVICNHESYLDCVFLYLCARPSQWIRFVARENLFDVAGGLLGQIIARVGAFPISRDSADRTALKRAVAMIKRKEIVGIMPEGTRRGRGSANLNLHSGFTLISRMAGDCPIIPMCLRGVGDIKKPGKFLSFPKVEIEFGKPLHLSDFECLEKSKRIDGCAWYAMREVFALKDKVNASEVNMKELFPEADDFSSTFENFKL